MIDLHSHVLAGIDDGPRTEAESLECIKGLSSFGFTELIPTPHRFHMLHNASVPETAAAVSRIRSSIIRRFSFEYAFNHGRIKMTKNLYELHCSPEGWTVILVEFLPFRARKKDILDAVFKLNAMGIRPLLAHIERYGHDDEFWTDLRKRYDMYLQIGLKSFSRNFFEARRRQIIRLLEQGVIDNAASDLHNVRQLPNVERAVDLLKRKFPNQFDSLFSLSFVNNI